MENQTQEQKNKRPFYKKWWFWVIVVFIIIIIFSNGNEENKNQGNNIKEEMNKEVLSDQGEEEIQEVINDTNPTKAIEEATLIQPKIAPTQEASSKTETTSDRDKMIAIFKEYALTEWRDDYSMVSYEIEKQTEAYDWIIRNASHTDILEKAKQEWVNDYSMVKYEYEKQVEAYEWINQQTEYPDILEKAKQEWVNDYAMVKYEYEKQVSAYESL